MSTDKINTESAEHYVWGGNCDGWRLVKTPELSIILERMPPGASEQRHHHTYARQFFFVLEGELTMEMEGVEQRLTQEQGLEIAPGEKHQAINRSSADVRFIVTSQPPSHGDRVLE